MRFVLTRPQGAGKGTQAQKLAKHPSPRELERGSPPRPTNQAGIAVRRVQRDGTDVIKLCAVGRFGRPADDEALIQAGIRTVVDEAYWLAGRPEAAPARGTTGILNSPRRRLTGIEHGHGLEERTWENGTLLVPTLPTDFERIAPAKRAPYHLRQADALVRDGHEEHGPGHRMRAAHRARR
ncbi:hypothetical protein [Streptomyces sp. LARHCF252]